MSDGIPQNGFASVERPGSSLSHTRAPIVRASTSAADVRHLVVAERDVQQHLVRRRVGYGSSVMCCA